MELIKIQENEKGNQVVSARDLHKFLENCDNINTWFKRQSERAMLIKNEDFERVAILQPSGQKGFDYALTLSSAKEIAMLNGGDKGKEARLYFIACEKKLKEVTTKPKTRRELAEENLNLIIEIEEKDAILLENAPKVEFFNQVVDSKTAISMNDAAKTLNLGIGRNTLFEFLRKEKVLMNNNTPYQKYIDVGYFRVVETKFQKRGDTCINLKTLVLQKGLDFIIKTYRNKK